MADTYVSERSTGTIANDLVRDLGDMVRSEVRLAGAEMVEKATQFGKASGMLGGAAICGLFAGACLVTALICLLAMAMPVGWAALITAVFLICIAGALYAGGRSKLKQIRPVPERTVQTIKETWNGGLTGPNPQRS